MKKIISVFLALLMLMGLTSAFLAISASADSEATTTVTPDNEEIVFNVSRNGNVLTVNFDAAKDFSIDGLLLQQSYADNITFNAANADELKDSAFPVQVFNPSNNKLAFTGNVSVNQGETLLSFDYTISDGFKEETDYTISYAIGEAYSDLYDIVYDDLEGKNFTVTYREDPVTVYHNVTFVNNGTQYGDVITVEDGKATAAPETDPTKENAAFKHWSLTNGGTAYDFAAPVTDDITLYAVYDAETVNGSNTVDLSKVEIKKTLNKDANVSIDETFTFKLEYVSMKPAASSGQVADESAIPNNITAVINNSGSVKLTSAEFPIGGVYTYKVTEVQGSTPGMTDDTTEYTLDLEIEENNNGNLELDTVVVKKNGEKASLDFTNSYAPTTTLKVSKKVTGEGNNPLRNNKKFNFSITFTESSVSNEQKVRVNGTELVYGTAFEFTLGDGEELEFTNIPEGTKYTIIEKGEEYYTPSAEIISGDTKNKKNGTYASDLTVSDVTIVKGTNEAKITNTYSITPPTGLFFNNDMFVILAVAMLALTGTFIVNRKLSKARR